MFKLFAADFTQRQFRGLARAFAFALLSLIIIPDGLSAAEPGARNGGRIRPNAAAAETPAPKATAENPNASGSLESCLGLYAKDLHMSKTEWAAICRRNRNDPDN